MVQSIRNLLLTIFGKPSKYKKDDTVEPVGGGALMVVISVRPGNRNTPAIITCQWFDDEQKKIMIGEFYEKDLKLFDWYHIS